MSAVPSKPALHLSPTPASWVATATQDLQALFVDHLHCERKAAQSALSLVRAYPEKAKLVEVVGRLAHEETAHVIQVTQLLTKNGYEIHHDHGDEYAWRLREHLHKKEPMRFLDSLLVFCVIEGRSAERLALLADALASPEDRKLYRGLASAEERHRDAFLELALLYVDEATVLTRLRQWEAIEAEIIKTVPHRSRIH